MSLAHWCQRWSTGEVGVLLDCRWFRTLPDRWGRRQGWNWPATSRYFLQNVLLPNKQAPTVSIQWMTREYVDDDDFRSRSNEERREISKKSLCFQFFGRLALYYSNDSGISSSSRTLTNVVVVYAYMFRIASSSKCYHNSSDSSSGGNSTRSSNAEVVAYAYLVVKSSVFIHWMPGVKSSVFIYWMPVHSCHKRQTLPLCVTK